MKLRKSSDAGWRWSVAVEARTVDEEGEEVRQEGGLMVLRRLRCFRYIILLISICATTLPMPSRARASQAITELSAALSFKGIVSKTASPVQDCLLIHDRRTCSALRTMREQAGVFVVRKNGQVAGRDSATRIIGGSFAASIFLDRQFLQKHHVVNFQRGRLTNILVGEVPCYRRSLNRLVVEICADDGNPSMVARFERVAQRMVSSPQNEGVYYCCDEEGRGPNDKPSRKALYSARMFEPPSPILMCGLIGVAFAVAGFVYLFGAHRRPHLGVCLYFGGIGIIAVASAFVVVLL